MEPSEPPASAHFQPGFRMWDVNIHGCTYFFVEEIPTRALMYKPVFVCLLVPFQAHIHKTYYYGYVELAKEARVNRIIEYSTTSCKDGGTVSPGGREPFQRRRLRAWHARPGRKLPYRPGS